MKRYKKDFEIFFYYNTKRKGKQSKQRQMGLYQTEKLLHIKANHQWVKNTTCGMEENECKACIF